MTAIPTGAVVGGGGPQGAMSARSGRHAHREVGLLHVFSNKRENELFIGIIIIMKRSMSLAKEYFLIGR